MTEEIADALAAVAEISLYDWPPFKGTDVQTAGEAFDLVVHIKGDSPSEFSTPDEFGEFLATLLAE